MQQARPTCNFTHLLWCPPQDPPLPHSLDILNCMYSCLSLLFSFYSRCSMSSFPHSSALLSFYILSYLLYIRLCAMPNVRCSLNYVYSCIIQFPRRTFRKTISAKKGFPPKLYFPTPDDLEKRRQQISKWLTSTLASHPKELEAFMRSQRMKYEEDELEILTPTGELPVYPFVPNLSTKTSYS